MAFKRSKGKSQIVQTLKGIPLFSACSGSELNEISSIVREVDFPAGQVICKEGTSGIGMHIVVEGDVKVQIGGRTRRRLGAGAFFGEIALLDGGPRTASVVADTAVKTLSVPQWEFKAMLKAHPNLTVKMLEEACRRLRVNDASLTN
jgi:CRP/FNR family transcriptional regulator, cyclic AMP receptor protein